MTPGNLSAAEISTAEDDRVRAACKKDLHIRLAGMVDIPRILGLPLDLGDSIYTPDRITDERHRNLPG